MIDGIENLKRAVADPPERMIADETEQPSYVAWLDRNDQYHEIGLVMFKAETHLLHCQLGPLKGEIIELRAVADEFKPGALKPERDRKKTEKQEPKPSYFAFTPGTDIRIGTAFPHHDGKGHRLKLRTDLADGAIIELRHSGHYYGAGERPRMKPGYHKTLKI